MWPLYLSSMLIFVVNIPPICKLDLFQLWVQFNHLVLGSWRSLSINIIFHYEKMLQQPSVLFNAPFAKTTVKLPFPVFLGKVRKYSVGWYIWDKAFKSGLADHILPNFLKTAVHKIHLVHSWILVSYILVFRDSIIKDLFPSLDLVTFEISLFMKRDWLPRTTFLRGAYLLII